MYHVKRLYIIYRLSLNHTRAIKTNFTIQPFSIIIRIPICNKISWLHIGKFSFWQDTCTHLLVHFLSRKSLSKTFHWFSGGKVSHKKHQKISMLHKNSILTGFVFQNSCGQLILLKRIIFVNSCKLNSVCSYNYCGLK